MSQTVFEPETKAPEQQRKTAPESMAPQSGTAIPAQPIPQQPPTSVPGQYMAGQFPVYGVPVVQPKGSNGLSIAALVCGIVGIVFAFIPVFGAPVGIVLGVLATAMGAIGRVRATSKGIGTAGLVLGILSLAVTIGWFVLAIVSSPR